MPSLSEVAFAILDFIQPFYERFGYLFVFLGSLFENTLFFGWIFPGNVMASLGGFYVHTGKLTLVGVLLTSTIGSIIGKNIDYFIGRFLGKLVVDKLRMQRQIKIGEHFIRKHGAKAFFITAVTGALRSVLMLTSGMMKISYSWFLRVVVVTSAIWGVILVVLGYFLGENRKLFEKVISYFGVFGWIIIIGFVIWKIIERNKGKEAELEDKILEKIDEQ